MTILFAIAQQLLSDVLRKELMENGLPVINDEVLHRNYLNEKIEMHNPSTVVIHDLFLPSELESQEERDLELLQLVQHWRTMYDNNLRIVFVCVRNKHDPLLSKLIALNVWDIFHEQSINKEQFVSQLKEPARYRNIQKFISSGHLSSEKVEAKQTSDDEEFDEAQEDFEVEENTSTTEGENKHPVKSVKEAILGNIKPPRTDKSKVQTKIVEKEVFVTTYQPVPQKLILIGSLYSNAGSSIVATNLARMIAERGIDVTYIENPLAEPRMYDMLQIAFRTEEYADFAQELLEDRIPNQEPFELKGVKWIVNTPHHRRIKEYSFETLQLLYQLTHSTITILDVSNFMNHPSILKLARFADEVILVMEANPIKNEYHLMYPDKDENVFTQFDDQQIKYKILLTKTGIKGVNMKTVREMLPQPAFMELPYIPYEVLMRNIFDVTLFYDDEGKEFLEEHMKELIYSTIPKHFATLNGGKSLFSRMFKRG